MSFFPENLKLMSSVGADERDAPAISVRNAAAAVALYAIASRDRCRLTGEWLRNAYADFMDNSGYPRSSTGASLISVLVRRRVEGVFRLVISLSRWWRHR